MFSGVPLPAPELILILPNYKSTNQNLSFQRKIKKKKKKKKNTSPSVSSSIPCFPQFLNVLISMFWITQSQLNKLAFK